MGSRFFVLPIVGAVVGFGLTVALVLSTTGYPLDDAWIHLDYARSLTTQQTFGYTPGSWENGSTAPLWSLLVAVPLAVGVAPTVAGKVVGLAALLALLFFVYRVASRVAGEFAGAIATALVALDPWTSVLSISGMEPVAAAAASFAAIDCFLRRRLLFAGIALAVAGLLRPELALLVPIFVLAGIPKATLREWLSLIAPPLAAGGGWMLYGVVVTGRALPNAYWMKTSGDLPLLLQLDSLRALFLAGPVSATVIVALLAIGGFGFLLRRKLLPSLPLWFPPIAILAAHTLILPLGADRGPMNPGSVENVYFARYPLLALPWLHVWVALGMKWLFDAIRSLAHRWSPRFAVSLAVAALLLPLALVVPSWQGHRAILARAYRANCNEIQTTQVALAQWIDEHLPDDSVIGVSDAGALRFYVRGRRVIDLMGLNNHEMIEQADPLGWLDEQGVTHLAIWPDWHPALLRAPRYHIELVRRVQIEDRTIVPGANLILCSLERKNAGERGQGG